jgi:hypothetical protein
LQGQAGALVAQGTGLHVEHIAEARGARLVLVEDRP